MSMESQMKTLDVAPMGQLSQARDHDDDWTGLKDRAERKKRQNRLNQRAWRKRQAESQAQARAALGKHQPPGSVFVFEHWGADEAASKVKPNVQVTALAHSSADFVAKAAALAVTATSTRQSDDHGAFAHRHLVLREWSISRNSSYDQTPQVPSKLPSSRRISPVIDYLDVGIKPWSPPPPASSLSTSRPLSSHQTTTLLPLSPDHRLITLIQFNVLRGTFVNLTILSLLSILPHECVGALPHIDITSLVPSDPSSIPPALRPTALQKSIPHAHWIDITPDPDMRDNMIRLEGTFDNDDMCDDLVGGLYEGLDDCESRGIMLWGDPWLVESWEVSKGFVRKWGFLLRGCRGTMEATDRWREFRGEEAIDWVGLGVVGKVV